MGEGRRDEGNVVDDDEVEDSGRRLQGGLDYLGREPSHLSEGVYRMDRRLELVGADHGQLHDAGLREISPAVGHDGRNQGRKRWKVAPDDPGEGLHLGEREVVPHSRDGKKPVAHGAPAAEAPYQLWGVGAPLLEDENGLMA